MNEIVLKLVLHNLRRKKANGESLTKLEKQILKAHSETTCTQ
jgi:hypothetical protein